RKVALYRQTMRARHGRDGHVTLMAHTFVGDRAEIDAKVRPALAAYLASSFTMQVERERGLGSGVDYERLSPANRKALVAGAVDRFVAESGLIGSTDGCAARAADLAAHGVDEIACLIDFGLARDDVMASLDRLLDVRTRI